MKISKEWIKDKTYYRKKCNDLEIENKEQRETFEIATREWAKQLTDKQAEIDFLRQKMEQKDHRLKQKIERIKELENGKTRK